MVAVLNDHKIGLFFTGRNHAGENLADLLARRESDLGPPIQMCDALSRNVPKDFKTLLANCISRSRHAKKKEIRMAAERTRALQSISQIKATCQGGRKYGF
jgi:hypothetical protein